MAKSYRPWTPNHTYLLPPSPSEWLPESHVAYFILDVVEGLDLAALEAKAQAKDPRGERAYQPRMMVALLLYAYATGMFSSRRIARATYEDVAVRVLAAGEHPSFTTINQFRLDHREAFADLFHQVLQLCIEAKLVKLGHVALDGTKIRANASKHKAMTHERMKKTDARLREEIDVLLGQADLADVTEDAQYGVGKASEDLPAELRRREDRLKVIAEARAALELEAATARAKVLREQAADHRATAADSGVPPAQQKAATTLAAQRDAAAAKLDHDPADRDDDDDDGPRSPLEPAAQLELATEPSPPPASESQRDAVPAAALPTHQVATDLAGQPTPKAQRNFTDPDSRIMPVRGGFEQAYNAQIVVDDESQIILAEAVTNQAPDCEHFGPLLSRAIQNCNAVPEVITADAGYFSQGNVALAEHLGSEPFMPPGRQRRSSAAVVAVSRSTPAADAMRSRLETSRGKSLYAKRKHTVEPVFGQIKAGRGFRQFLLRGLTKVRNEWTLICLTHNLLKVFRARRTGAAALSPA